MPMVVANRYARALADVVEASGDYRKVLEELQDFEATYRESPELREVLDFARRDLAAEDEGAGSDRAETGLNLR